MLKKIGSAISLMLLLCGVVVGEPTAALQVEPESFVAGRAFDAVLFVRGAECSKPEWRGAGFTVIERDSQVVGSGTNQTHSFSFRLVPLHAGKLALPLFWVACDNEELETEPQVVTVQKPRESADLTLSASVSAQEVFVGQPIRYVAEWRVGFDPRQLRAVSIFQPLQSMTHLRALDVVPDFEKVVGLPVGNRRVMAGVAEAELDGKKMTVYRFEQIIVPQEPGELRIPPMNLLCSRVPGSKGGFYQNVPSYFDNSFFEQVESHEAFSEYYAESKPLTLTVRPLPVNESMTPFSGIVGKSSLQVEVFSQEIKVGAPLQLTLRLQAPFVQALKLPDLRSFNALARSFWIPEAQSEGRVENGARVYEQSVRPLHTGVQMVPPLELLVFNPETARYEMVASEAISLDVLPNEGQTRFVSPQLDDTEHERELNAEGIWFNREVSAGLLDRVARWAVSYWYLWLTVPLAICLLLEPFARRHRLFLTDPKRARALSAYSRFRRRLIRNHVDTAELLQDYLAERFGFQRGTVTRGDMVKVLQQHRISESVVNELIDLMSGLDQEHFSPRSEPKNQRKLAASIIRKLEGEVSR
ncbi:hypothetical protein ACFLQY_00945 [Verrucomicrobiota bacterium]